MKSVEVKNLIKSFYIGKEEVKVLKDLNFSVKRAWEGANEKKRCRFCISIP